MTGNTTYSKDKSARMAAKVRTLWERQGQILWGPDYRAGKRAVPQEAPRKSKPRTLPSAKLSRTLQLMSRPEGKLAPLALYHPDLWEMHEQHVLYVEPMAHPLSFHRAYRDRRWPASSGTLALADRLGLIARHPTYFDAAEQTYVPVPWLGDFLLFLHDVRGPYLVSWDVKLTTGAHGAPQAGARVRPSKQEIRKAEVREAVYQAYMRELGIPIVQITPDHVDQNLLATLAQLARLHAREVHLPDDQQVVLQQAFQRALVDGEPPMFVIQRLVPDQSKRGEARTLLHQLVWQRKLRVDLWQPLVMDVPLVPERIDPLVEYAHLFSRQAGATS